MVHISFFQSRNIQDYEVLLEELPKEFGPSYREAPLQRCGLATKKGDTNFREVYLIQDMETKHIIGTCGLYALFPNYTKELWLSWFAVLPAYRGKGVGSQALRFLSTEAKKFGAEWIYSYVNKKGDPLPFYKKNGFTQQGRVKDYIADKKIDNFDRYFENTDDFVIRKNVILDRR